MLLEPMHLFLVEKPSLSVYVVQSQPGAFCECLASAHVTKGLEMRMGSSRERNSTVPIAEEGSIGVNTKWFRGDTHTTSYFSVSTTCYQGRLHAAAVLLGPSLHGAAWGKYLLSQIQ